MDLLKDCVELPPNAKEVKINFDLVEMILDVDGYSTGHVIAFTSGMKLFVSEEQKTLIKTLDKKLDKG